MPFTVHYEAGKADGGGIMSDRRLYLAADQTTVVEHDDKRAATLLCGAGCAIAGSEVRRLGLAVVNGKVSQQAALPEKVENSKTGSTEKRERK